MRKLISITILISVFFQNSASQEYLNRDSLIRLLNSPMNDTTRVLLYISIGQQYENNIPDSAIYYYTQARNLSKQTDYNTGMMKYLSNITYVYNSQGKYDTALILNLQSLELAKKHGTLQQLAACLGNVANSYLFLEKYENSVDYFLQTSELISKTGNNQYQCILYNNLAVVYVKLKRPDKAMEYARKAVLLAKQINDPYNLGISLDNLGLSYIESDKPDSSLLYLQQALDIAEQTQNLYVKESIMINFSDAYLQMGEYIKMRPYAEMGMKLAKELDDMAGQSAASLGLGYYFLYLDQEDIALNYAHLAEKSAVSDHLTEQLRKVYQLMSYISLSEKKFINFRNYQFKHDSIEDLIYNQMILRNIQDLETKYETEKKTQLIRQLEQEQEIQKLRLRQTQFILLTLTGVIFTIVLLIIFLIRGHKHKRIFYEKEKELQQIKINELESEKQLLATEAVLKGQEEERTRLARDLHDSLGGMLSGIKMSFNNLKEILAKKSEDQQMFDRSLDMLDGSIVELRTIAHNLMPESLLKFGLDASVSDYCERINSSGTIKVKYQSAGLETYTTSQSVIINVYRIIQELINNTLKHASATYIYIQLVNQNGLLEITIEDDGAGFDVDMLRNSPGIGWKNIYNRIDYLKGRIDIQSEPQKGTTVNIYI